MPAAAAATSSDHAETSTCVHCGRLNSGTPAASSACRRQTATLSSCQRRLVQLVCLCVLTTMITMLLVDHLFGRSTLVPLFLQPGRGEGGRPFGGAAAEAADVCAGERQPPLLCIFTTFKPAYHKIPVYTNTLHNWMSLDATSRCNIRPFIFIPPNNSYPLNDTLVQRATELGWRVFELQRTAVRGFPYIRDMFKEAMQHVRKCAFYGFANGDILFDDGLIPTLQAVQKNLSRLGQTMVVGQRANVNMSGLSAIDRPRDVDRLAKSSGKLHYGWAIDYFLIAGGRFPWDFVPDLLIGSQRIDSFMLVIADRRNVSVIDATRTVTALHQVDSDGLGAGNHNPGSGANLAIARDIAYVYDGQTYKTRYLTDRRGWTSVKEGLAVEHGNMTSGDVQIKLRTKRR